MIHREVVIPPILALYVLLMTYVTGKVPLLGLGIRVKVYLRIIGEILIGKLRENIPILVDIWSGEKAVLNQHIFKVEFDETKAIKMYMYLALNKAVAEVENNLHGGVGLVHITKGNLEKIEIPLPPLEVQKEIVAEIEGGAE